MICLVVAMAKNRVIGSAGGLPWHLPADLKHFKALTMGKPMIMGRKTFGSIGRALPGRTNIVVTRDADFEAEGVISADSLEAALTLAGEEASEEADEIMIIGGGQIYELALPLAERIYLTEVDAEPEGDVLFPEIDTDQWRLTSRQEHPAASDAPAYAFLKFARRTGEGML